jgi:cell fate regulator YaaT (PSP1 superfamily)
VAWEGVDALFVARHVSRNSNLFPDENTYKALKKRFPKINKMVTTKKGKGKVLRHNIISNRLTIRLDDGQEIETGLDEIIQEQEHK